jgi:hypothetical protein
MEPRFKIIGNEVKGDGKTYIASPELKERFGDNEFGEKDFELDTPDRHKACKNGCEWQQCHSIMECRYVDDTLPFIAYPVSRREQESQEDLWWSLKDKISDMIEKGDMPKDVVNYLKQHYTITKNK